MSKSGNKAEHPAIAALYCRLSQDDGRDGDSNSIANQKELLLDYAKKHGFLTTEFFVDDGYSGTNFDRPSFQRMQKMVEAGLIGAIIVKDLSRFGRNYLEVGRYLELIYPSLGIQFIAIHENIDTLKNCGIELMPFSNIFNEWYAAQTSKKIKAIHQMRANSGKRIGATIPYGYVRSADHWDQWEIDPQTAPNVKRIFSLCLDGFGPTEIAKILEKDCILTPSAYRISIGLAPAGRTSYSNFAWHSTSVSNILDNLEYTGCIVNRKSTKISYKINKTIRNPKEEWQVIPNAHEAIIDHNLYLRIQELRSNRHRRTKVGRKSIFSNLVYCADCGSKMHFCSGANRSLNQEFFRCSAYKSSRGTCSSHYIGNRALEQLVLATIQELSDFVRSYEPVFLFMMEEKNRELQVSKANTLRKEIASAKKRIEELDRLIERIYEDNVLGKISDDRFMRMSRNFESEQHNLMHTLSQNEEALDHHNRSEKSLRLLLDTLRQTTSIEELSSTLINTLIQRIEVHERHGRKSPVKIDIYFTALGLFEMPSKKELQKIIEHFSRNNSIQSTCL